MCNLRVILVIVFSLISAGATAEEGFHDETELGTAIISGNTNSETYNLKQLSSYGWDKDLIKLSGRYLNTRSTSGTAPTQTPLADTARSWDAALRYERVLSDVLNAFVSYGLESDVFAGFVQRNDFDLGAKYFLAKGDITNWSAEGGYRNIVTHFGTLLSDSNTSNLRLYSEATQKMTETATFKIYLEFIQAVSSNISTTGYSVGQDYQFNAEPSVSVMMSKVFSLKTAYLFKYRNYSPVTPKYLDTVFTTSVLAKF